MDGKSLSRFARGKKAGPAPARHDHAPLASAAPAAPQLNQPPPGYAWAWMGNQYVLVPLQQQAPQAYQPPPGYAPPQQYGAPPAPPQPPGPGARVIPIRPQSNMLVRDNGQDLWAEKLAAMPDLPVQQTPGTEGYDAMAGNPSPLSIAALGPLLNEDVEARAAHAYADQPLHHDPKFRPPVDLVDRNAGKE
jgi:hypothetical protein